jgi:hypothetical protein
MQNGSVFERSGDEDQMFGSSGGAKWAQTVNESIAE